MAPENDCSPTADLTHFLWAFAMLRGFSVSVLLTFWARFLLRGWGWAGVGETVPCAL